MRGFHVEGPADAGGNADDAQARSLVFQGEGNVTESLKKWFTRLPGVELLLPASDGLEEVGTIVHLDGERPGLVVIPAVALHEETSEVEGL